LRRKLLPQDEEWESQGRDTAADIHVDVDREDEFIEWCQTRFLEITDGREYTRGTKTKEERGTESDEESSPEEEDGEGENGIGLGAALKYLAQGWQPTNPPQSNGRSMGK
jgi:hypothetical protein